MSISPPFPPLIINRSSPAHRFAAFVVPTSTFGVEFSDYNSADLLTELVAAAHAKDSKVLIAVGGWSDSAYFSDAVKNAANRATFVKAIAALVNKYNVDGVDIDW